MEQRTLKSLNNYLKTNIYSWLETSGGHLYLNVVHIFNTSVNWTSVADCCSFYTPHGIS
jgi:hypothetical protein